MAQRILIIVSVLAIVVALALVPFAPKPIPAARPTVAAAPERPRRPTSRPARFRHVTTAPYVFTSLGRPTSRPRRPLPSGFALPGPDADEPPAPEPVYPESLAREALAYVGLDQDADEVWYTAVNDPALPPDARRELIADLNQEGLPDDPRNLTAADLPLIEARLAIIEAVAPDTEDDTNAEAFTEAYRDLLAMYERLAPPPPMDEPEPPSEPAPDAARATPGAPPQ